MFDAENKGNTKTCAAFPIDRQRRSSRSEIDLLFREVFGIVLMQILSALPTHDCTLIDEMSLNTSHTSPDHTFPPWHPLSKASRAAGRCSVNINMNRRNKETRYTHLTHPHTPLTSPHAFFHSSSSIERSINLFHTASTFSYFISISHQYSA